MTQQQLETQLIKPTNVSNNSPSPHGCHFRVSMSCLSLFAELALELVVGEVVLLEELLGGEEGGARAAPPTDSGLCLVAGHDHGGDGT